MDLTVNLESVLGDMSIEKALQLIQVNGIQYFELWDWRHYELGLLRSSIQAAEGVRLSLISGNREFGSLDCEVRKNFLREIRGNIRVGKSLGCTCVNVLTEVLDESSHAVQARRKMSDTQKLLELYDSLKHLAVIAEEEGITVVVEILNTIVDHPGYFLDQSKIAFELVRAVNSPFLKVLYDIYHMQIMEGNIIETLDSNIDEIGYIHLADVPGRHEPGTGEINFSNIACALRRNEYHGFVALEAFPEGDSVQAIRAFKDAFEI